MRHRLDAMQKVSQLPQAYQRMINPPPIPSPWEAARDEFLQRKVIEQLEQLASGEAAK
ncbi:MAG: hypothetical protein FWD61_09510 [Phycisphaerales bacterium]|nr:hypothetical protein [Phycisphaerales bacterium]